MIKRLFKKITQQIRISLGIVEIKHDLSIVKSVAIERYIHELLSTSQKYTNPKMLNTYEYQVYSQFGEDGIIGEIFKRIGTTNQYFVEIGAADGMENNTTHLLINQWEGVWIEGNTELVDNAKKYFDTFVTRKKLQIKQAFVTTENIRNIFKTLKIPKEFDFLSIDIDGNDYWIWEAISDYKPRAVCIEYNSSLGSTSEWIMKYDEAHTYNYTNYFGTSLKSLEILGRKMGYTLVGCSLAGTNAFFVRSDLAKSKFAKPSTSENLYEPPRYFLYSRPGHLKNPSIFNDFIVK